MTDYQEQPPVANPNPQVPPQQYYSPPPPDPRHNEDPRRKSQGLAMFLSLMPGLGQVYVGYYQQGFIHIVVVASLISLLEAGIGDLQPLGGLFLAFFWLYNIVDAGRRATAYNQSLIGLDEAELPENLSSSSTTGALVGGVLLVVFGLLFFAHNMFDVSLQWIEDWWPVAIIGLGAYLIYKGYRDWAKRQGEAS